MPGAGRRTYGFQRVPTERARRSNDNSLPRAGGHAPCPSPTTRMSHVPSVFPRDRPDERTEEPP
ncbi:hypothetical protein GCM10010279_66450 [Streptomyces mutabilis]|nr:hypothetical protein GCM10010279_66450 [Streptomyces mutabilis]